MAGRIGIDIGGTFTDVVYFRDGGVVWGKADTTHYDLKVGVLNAIKAAAQNAALDFEETVRDADAIVYSTTVGTNALIERKGTRLGLITTKGFEDTVQVGRGRNWGDGLEHAKRYDRGRARRPEAIVPRELIIGVQERIDNLGNTFIPLRDDDVRRAIKTLADQGVRGFVVVLLNSYINPAHELRIGELIREQFSETCLGHMPVYLSHQISPKLGEYRRSMTVILDAYLREVTEEHLLRLSDELRDMGYARPVFVSRNTGGLSSVSRSQAIHLFGSSPAATVVGSDHIGRMIGQHNVIVSDMGGTSFDVGLVVEGSDRVYELDPVIDRFRVQIPYIAHWSIGAGGGSIASVVDGALSVGPESAGSNPGPACYDRGGERPTVADADVVLGYINPDNFLGGTKRIIPEKSHKAIADHIAAPLGISPLEAAWRIKVLIDGFMGQEMYRICSLVSGEDPRDFVLFALGGGGPLHAAGYAERTDIRKVAVFPFSSVFGAFSTLGMDIVQSYEISVDANLFAYRTASYNPNGMEIINNAVDGLLQLSERDMLEEGFDLSTIALQVELQMSYGQQRQTLSVQSPTLKLSSIDDLKAICDRFDELYGAKFGAGACFREAGIEVNQIRLNAVGPVDKFVLRPVTTPSATKAVGSRSAYWGPDHGTLESPIYDRDQLRAGVVVDGPALIEGVDTVIVTPPGWRYSCDEMRVGWLERIG